MVGFKLYLKDQGSTPEVLNVAVPFQCLVFPVLSSEAGTESTLGRQESSLGTAMPRWEPVSSVLRWWCQLGTASPKAPPQDPCVNSWGVSRSSGPASQSAQGTSGSQVPPAPPGDTQHFCGVWPLRLCPQIWNGHLCLLLVSPQSFDRVSALCPQGHPCWAPCALLGRSLQLDSGS